MPADSPPHLSFFCELETPELQALVADRTVIEHLQALKASVSLAVLDHSVARADAARLLNQAGIPVTAWLLLPKQEGYFFNADNYGEAARSYTEFKEWTARHQLHWEGVGLDIEPDIRDLQQMASRGRAWSLRMLARRFFDHAPVRRAQSAYAALVGQTRGDGYAVESYEVPFIVDARPTGSTLLQRLFRIVDLQVDRQVLMLYTSFWGPLGPGMLWSYGRDAQAIAVGITGAGVESEGIFAAPLLSPDEFERDLLLARHWTDNIYVYSLEGCVRQELLPLLQKIDWEREVEPPRQSLKKMERLRRAEQSILWMDAHPAVVLGALALLWLWSRRRSSIERKD